MAETTSRIMKEINEGRGEYNKVLLLLDINYHTKYDKILPENVRSAVGIIVHSTLAPTTFPFVPPELGSGGEELYSIPIKEDPWAKRYWWVILSICVGSVLLISLIGLIICISKRKSKISAKTDKEIEMGENSVIRIENGNGNGRV